MPIYDFNCNKCNKIFSKFFSIKTVPELEAKQKCEFCGKKIAKRQLSIPNISDGPKTVGSLMEQNTKKYGIKQKQNKKNKVLTSFGEIDLSIAKKVKNKQKYIETGEIN